MFKGISAKLLFLFLMRILPTVMEQVTPALRSSLVAWIIRFEEQAKETDNPYDDILAELLKVIFGIED